MCAWRQGRLSPGFAVAFLAAPSPVSQSSTKGEALGFSRRRVATQGKDNPPRIAVAGGTGLPVLCPCVTPGWRDGLLR